MMPVTKRPNTIVQSAIVLFEGIDGTLPPQTRVNEDVVQVARPHSSQRTDPLTKVSEAPGSTELRSRGVDFYGHERFHDLFFMYPAPDLSLVIV